MKLNYLIISLIITLHCLVLQAGGSATTVNSHDFEGMQIATNQSRPFLRDRMYPDDRFIVTIFTDFWQNLPGDMALKSIQRGISISALQDMPLSRTNFSLAAGLAFTSHNLYSDHRYLYHVHHDKFDFYPIDKEHTYDKNKLSINYLEVPVEFRYRSRTLPRTFRFYTGMKVGWLVNAHTKFVGETYWYLLYDGDESGATPTVREVKIKEHRLQNIADYRIGITGTIGYGNVNLHVYYPLTAIFTDNSAKDASLFSVGLSIILF